MTGKRLNRSGMVILPTIDRVPPHWRSLSAPVWAWVSVTLTGAGWALLLSALYGSPLP